MCGITGFFETTTDRSRNESLVIGKTMMDAIPHRGPDAADTWQDSDLPLLLAHRRLSILDLSAEGAQPMTSPSGRYVIVYNGEIYNHQDLRRELPQAQWRGGSDTETLLAAIDQYGLNRTVQKLNGMFAFALWDRKERQLHLIRDRFGKKPLYVGWAGKSLVFGSELKTLGAHPDFTPQINRKAMEQMIARGYCIAPSCIYEGVWSIPAGHRLSLDCNALSPNADLSKQMVSYWDARQAAELAKSNPMSGSTEDITQEFDTLLGTCVSDRMLSDVPLGAFLSGGIDSSAVVAHMQKQSSTPIKTYTIGFHEAGFNEAAYAAKIAAHLGTDHHEIYLGARDALDVIPQLPDMYDEPFADISAIPTYLVSKFARQDVTVALSGDGGDEMLGGYARHVQGPKLWSITGKMPTIMRSTVAGAITAIGPQIWDKINPTHPQFGSRMHKAARTLSMDSQAAIYENILSAWPQSPLLGNNGEGTSAHEAAPLESFAEAMMLWDTTGYLPNDVLTKVDRATMAVSLEARAPLLDRRIFEFAWRLPLDMKIKHGKGKHILRKTLNRYVPDYLFDRPKQGFTMPVGDWLRSDLRDWAEDLLDEKTLREDGLLDPATIRATWDEHQNGQGNHAQKLWHVLMFQAWHKRWMKV